MINYQTITIDLQPDYREPVVQMYLSERDVGRPIQVNVLMQGQPYSFIAGTTVHIDLRKPSGHVVQVNGNYAVGSNVVLFNVVEQMAAEPGMCLTELSIVGDGQDPIGSKNWLTKVELSPMHAGDPSETWIEDLDELVQEAMEGHIDATLSIPGDAADAAAVGEEIADLKSAVNANAEFISDLYSETGIDIEYVATLKPIGVRTALFPISLKADHQYTISGIRLDQSNTNGIYLYIRTRDDATLLAQCDIPSGTNQNSIAYTPSVDTDAVVWMTVTGSAIDTSCKILLTDADGEMSVLKNEITNNGKSISNIDSYIKYVEMPEYKADIPANAWTSIASLEAKTPKSYKITFAIPHALGSIVYCSIRNMATETTRVSGNITIGSTSVTLDYTPSVNETVALRAYTGASGGAEITVTIDDGESYANIYDALQYAQVPSYYLSGNYLDGRIADIIENSLVETGESFVFITDLHLASNSGASKALVKHVLDKTPIPFVISGGDIPNAYSQTGGNEKAEILAYIKEWLEWVDFWGQDRVYRMRGNHDYVLVKQGDSSKYYNIPNGGVHQIIMPKFVDRVLCPEMKRNYYHFDNETQKIRYIVIDGHTYLSSSPTAVTSWIYAAQINWLINLLNESDGYSIVVLSHEACDSALSSYATNLAIVQTLLEAFVSRGTVSTTASGASITADFTNCTGNLVCVLSGHSHKDESHVSNGVLAISTTCDAFYNNDPPITRTRGTITESAFDVFSIDTTAKTIKTTRIGAGSDRGWNYETGEALN